MPPHLGTILYRGKLLTDRDRRLQRLPDSRFACFRNVSRIDSARGIANTGFGQQRSLPEIFATVAIGKKLPISENVRWDIVTY